jgi:hypothetical protein
MRSRQQQEFALLPAIIAAVFYLVMVNVNNWINAQPAKPSGIVYPIHAGP